LAYRLCPLTESSTNSDLLLGNAVIDSLPESA
jgi:hypothetical protein